MAIHILSSEVIDQIAAGEVVERPSHLVKELVENSIDAGATELEVEYEQGGRFVKVIDNGCGIEKSELHLSLSRHATSKIKAADDLWDLSSFGFRGEALSSLSAVSKLTLVSKVKNQKSAYQLVSEFGSLSEVVPVGGDQGTSIVIERLFENVPARLKFLKSESAEGTQIKNVLKAMALSNPGVSFRVRNKGKLVFYWPAIAGENLDQNKLKRAEQVLDQENLYFGEADVLGCKVQVALSAPNNTAKTSKQIWLFVQNRWVQDRGLQAAVRDGFRGLLMHGEFPICAVWLATKPDQVDVNIHPNKSQIKFETPSNAFRAVLRTTRAVLEEAPWLEGLLGASNEFNNNSSNPVPPLQAPPEFNDVFIGDEFNKSQFKQKSSFKDFSAAPEVSGAIDTYSYKYLNAESIKKQFQGANSATLLNEKSEGSTFNLDKSSSASTAPSVPSETTQKGYWANLQVLGQANLTYILSQSRNGLVIIDQHAAHERVAYERLMLSWKTGNFEIQNYLIPLIVDLEVEQVDVLIDNIQEINKLGIELDRSGPSTLSVRAAPVLVSEKSLIVVLQRFANELIDKGGSFAMEKHISGLCATLACHSVVRAGQALSLEEMNLLLVQMDEFSLSSFCPHGRPVFVEYPYYKLERDFGRTV